MADTKEFGITEKPAALNDLKPDLEVSDATLTTSRSGNEVLKVRNIYRLCSHLMIWARDQYAEQMLITL
jgi:hypothetical protein